MNSCPQCLLTLGILILSNLMTGTVVSSLAPDPVKPAEIASAITQATQANADMLREVVSQTAARDDSQDTFIQDLIDKGAPQPVTLASAVDAELQPGSKVTFDAPGKPRQDGSVPKHSFECVAASGSASTPEPAAHAPRLDGFRRAAYVGPGGRAEPTWHDYWRDSSVAGLFPPVGAVALYNGPVEFHLDEFPRLYSGIVGAPSVIGAPRMEMNRVPYPDPQPPIPIPAPVWLFLSAVVLAAGISWRKKRTG